MLLLGFEFSGDAYNSNPDWNNFKISSCISWSFFIHINTIFIMAKKQIAKFELNPEDVGFDKMLNISV